MWFVAEHRACLGRLIDVRRFGHMLLDGRKATQLDRQGESCGTDIGVWIRRWLTLYG